MPILTLLAVTAQNDSTRAFLFFLVLFAVFLILAGGTVAVLTFYNQRKVAMTEADEDNRE